MNYWLVKSEPEKYAWADLVREGETFWNGVRNYQARNNLAAMKLGDHLLYYHSVDDKCVVGIAAVSKEAYPDHTAEEPGWVMVDIKPHKALKHPVTLAQIKANPALAQIALVRQSRLSVVPLTKAEFMEIVNMSENKA